MVTSSLDLETTSLDPHKGRILSASWCGMDLKPVSRDWTPSVRARVATLVGDPKNIIITQNGVFDYSWLVFDGLTIRAKRNDTMIGSHVVESNMPANLGSLVSRYVVQAHLDKLGIKVKVDYQWKKEGPDAWLKENKRWFRSTYGRDPHMGDVPPPMRHDYARKDALYTLLVWYAMRDYLKGSNKFTYNLDMAMLPILVGMKTRGIPIDLELCRREIKTLGRQQAKTLKRYGVDKLGPLALTNIIFPKLGIKLKYKTDSEKNWSFSERTLRMYQRQYPEQSDKLEEIIQFRKARTSQRTYYGNYVKFSYHRKIYPTFNLTKAKTGRLSSSAPNLQNVKKKGKERKVFLARPGYVNLHWDYDQIELRLIAHYSRDKQLLHIFRNGLDPHIRTANLMDITEKSIKKFTSGILRRMNPRDVGKNLNYSFWFGMGIDTFSLDLGIPNSKGAELFERYRNAYPDAVAWSRQLISDAKQCGYVEDIFGRQYRSDDRWSYYKLVNYLIQGTAAQCIKIGMLRAQKYLHRDQQNLTIIREIPPHTMRGIQLLTVHDEIGIEIVDKRIPVERVARKVTKALAIRGTFRIPLTVGCKWTRTCWGELNKFPIPWKGKYAKAS